MTEPLSVPIFIRKTSVIGEFAEGTPAELSAAAALVTVDLQGVMSPSDKSKLDTLTPFADQWQGAWSASLGYLVNDIVGYSGSSYVCLINRSATATTPNNDPSHWAVLAASGGSAVITDHSITNVKLVEVATATFKGRYTAGTGDVEDLTVSQAQALLGVGDGQDLLNAINADSDRILKDSTDTPSENWNARTLLDTAGQFAAKWGDRQLTTGAGNATLDWNLSQLIIPGVGPSLDWSQYLLKDSNGTGAINWNDRTLIDINGTPQINWTTAGIIDFLTHEITNCGNITCGVVTSSTINATNSSGAALNLLSTGADNAGYLHLERIDTPARYLDIYGDFNGDFQAIVANQHLIIQGKGSISLYQGTDETIVIDSNGLNLLVGNILMGTHKITGLGDPTDSQDAVTLSYLNTQTGSFVPYTGATGAVNINTNDFTTETNIHCDALYANAVNSGQQSIANGGLYMTGYTTGTLFLQCASDSGLNLNLTFPATDGVADAFLRTDGAGVSSWAKVGVPSFNSNSIVYGTDTLALGVAQITAISPGCVISLTPNLTVGSGTGMLSALDNGDGTYAIESTDVADSRNFCWMAFLVN